MCEVLTDVSMKIQVFRYVTSCQPTFRKIEAPLTPVGLIARLTTKIQELDSFETSVIIYQSKGRNISEDLNLGT
jgi:hypothetical protein